MRTFLRPYGLILLGSLLFLLRFDGALDGFEKGRRSLPAGAKGRYRAMVLEEPQVLFPREKGSRATGRMGASYDPGVREVRSPCLLLSRDGVPLLPVKARCSFRLSPRTPSPVLSYGDIVAFDGKVQVPRRALNPGQFDYERYLRVKGVAFTAYLAPGSWSKEASGRSGAFLAQACHRLKRAAEEALCRHLPYPESALLDGILLGEKASLPRDMLEDFFLTGTVHILAVSGLMTAFVSGVLFLLLRALGLPRKGAACVSLAGLACFVCMTGADPPVCRAGLFSGLALGSVLFERRVHSGTLLIVTALLLVFLDPFVLFDLSFQISFLATAGLMAWTPGLLERLSFLGKRLGGLVATTFSAQLAVWTLLVFHFNQASPYAFLANLAVVPLALLATLGGLVLLIGAAIHPLLGEALGGPCALILRALTSCNGWIAALPGGEGLVPSPPGRWVAVFHVLLAATFLAFWPRQVPDRPSIDWIEGRRRWSRTRRLVALAWGCFTIHGLAQGCLTWVGPPKLRVTFLAVGHGNAAVLEVPGQKALVVDAGRRAWGPDRYHPLVAYLRHRGLREVGKVLATHPDSDHVGGMTNLAGACRWESLLVPDGGDLAPFPPHLLACAAGAGAAITVLRRGDVLVLGDRSQGEVLHPDRGFRPSRAQDNNLSLAVRFRYGTTSFLFPGDLEKEGLDRLLASPGAGKVDWLLAPHHGRRSGEPSASSEGFSPRFVVFSDGKDHPDSRSLYREGAPGVLVLSTARDGAIEVEVGPEGDGRYRTFLEGKWRSLPTGGGADVDFIEK